MENKLQSAKQIASVLKISEVTLARMRCEGSGPAYVKLGRSVKYRPSDIETWLKACTRTSTSETA